jgi:hypothetical protein
LVDEVIQSHAVDLGLTPPVRHPEANADDWNNSNVTVHFDATDTDPGTGLVSVTPDQLISTETGEG